MKLQTFDKSLVRSYIESSSALDAGINFVKKSNPSASPLVARETAIRLAVDYCEKLWLRDSSGYISSEYVAFTEFEKDVRAKRFFYTKAMIEDENERERRERHEAEQESRWSREKSRVTNLRLWCIENNKDFETENKKAVEILKKKNLQTIIIEWCSALGFLADIFFWVFTDIGNWKLWLPILIICITAFFVTDTKIDPKLPDDFFKKIKDGSYKFDS